MSASVNKVIVVGNLGRDPEVRYSTDGAAITTISVATSDRWKDKATGEMKENTEWHRIVFFGRLAEIAGEYLAKGSVVYIEGRLRTRKWEKDGVERYSTEILADQMQMLSKRERSETGGARPAPQQRKPKPEDADPTHGVGKSTSMADMDDDVPFLFNVCSVRDTMGAPKSWWRARYGKGLSILRANKTEF